MTVHTQIRRSEDNFKLALAICQELSSHVKKTEEELWNLLSPNSSISKMQKKFKREKRRNDPFSSVKKPRTAYSFFTKDRRQAIQDENPNVEFGDVSKLVAKAWKKLSDSQMAKFKKREFEDKERYNTEKAAVLAELERNPPPAPVQTEEETPAETTPVVKPAKKSGSKTSKEPKAAKAEKAAPVKKAATNKKVKGQGKNKKEDSNKEEANKEEAVVSV